MSRAWFSVTIWYFHEFILTLLVYEIGSRISKILISSWSRTPFSGCFSKKKWKKCLNLWGEKAVIIELTVAHVLDVLEQNPSGFELYSPKNWFLIARQRHIFKLIDPNRHTVPIPRILNQFWIFFACKYFCWFWFSSTLIRKFKGPRYFHW